MLFYIVYLECKNRLLEKVVMHIEHNSLLYLFNSLGFNIVKLITIHFMISEFQTILLLHLFKHNNNNFPF